MTLVTKYDREMNPLKKESNYKSRAIAKKVKEKPVDVTEHASAAMRGIPSYLKRNKK